MMKEMLHHTARLPEISPRTGKPKRRKAIRACVHCQRTHLTCDNNRPCERCVDRGLATTCCDGIRKRAKYLGDDGKAKQGPPAKRAAPGPRFSESSAGPSSANTVKPVAGTPHGHPQHQTQYLSEQLYQVPLPHHQPADIQGPRGPQGPHDNPAPHSSHAPPPPPLHQPQGQIHSANASSLVPYGFQSTTADSEYSVLSSMVHLYGSDGSPYSDSSDFPQNTLTLENFNMDKLYDESPMNDWLAPPKQPPISLTINQPLHQGGDGHPSQVYSVVSQPFPYTPGFHALFAYLKSRFKKPQLMQIVKSMARYRPSFIAYASNLTLQDLIFLEQGFQRSLLEYEKYFHFSGTPTIIWRRTGQIAAVGHEFCMLSGYQTQDLLPQQDSNPNGKFIVELMDDESTLSYFQTFSEIAFGDHRGVRMAACTLLTKSGKSVRTSSVLTLKRDMFGIPMLIIGNFLPILI